MDNVIRQQTLGVYMPFAPEVMDGSGHWVRNGCRFESYDETAAYLADLETYWLAIRDTRITEVDDPVTHFWNFNTVSLHPIEG